MVSIVDRQGKNEFIEHQIVKQCSEQWTLVIVRGLETIINEFLPLEILSVDIPFGNLLDMRETPYVEIGGNLPISCCVSCLGPIEDLSRLNNKQHMVPSGGITSLKNSKYESWSNLLGQGNDCVITSYGVSVKIMKSTNLCGFCS